MLHAHPDLALPRETRFLLETYRDRQRFGDLRVEANRGALAEWIVRNPQATQFRRLGLDADAAVQRLSCAPPTIGSVVGTAFQLFAARHGTHRWGDKRPMYVLHLPSIFSMFPDAQFINVVRDPRGAVASMKKLGWYGGDVRTAVELWLRSMRSARRAARRYRPDQFRELRYEDLVTRPVEALAGLCRFLGLPPDHIDRMVSFHEGVDVPVNRYHWRVSQPLTDEPLRGWMEVLTPSEVALVEAEAGALMERYGYESAGARVSGQRPAHKAKRAKRAETPSQSYPYPVAARLTTAQRRRHALERVVGRM